MADFLDLGAISQRLRELYERSGMMAKEFAAKVGIAQSTLSGILNAKQEINVPIINKVIATHSTEELDPYWLLFGGSEALPFEGASQLPRAEAAADSPALAPLLDRLEAQCLEIERLKAELAALSHTRSIDHIAIYYSDNSFERFRSELPTE